MRASCVAIDIINADKPPASLAFLAGTCEVAQVPYQCISLNSKFLGALSTEEYNDLYARVRLATVTESIEISASVDAVLAQIVADIQAYGAEIVLVSMFSFMQYQMAVKFLQRLKDSVPGVEVLAGGPGVGYTDSVGQTYGKRLLDQQLVTAYCLGEGDAVLPKYLLGDRDSLGITKADQIESWVPQIDDLDSVYVVPSYRQIEISHYSNLEGKDAVFSISTSRGCVRRCTFCDVAKTWPKYRYRSGQRVAEEILEHHRAVGAVNFTIVDSLINGSLKQFREFNQAMLGLKQQYPSLEQFSYNGMFIVRDARAHTEEFFQLIKQAGCESLSIGVETGSERLRFAMDKRFTNQDLDHHLKMSQKYGIKNFLLMFVGYPQETKDDFEATLEMLARYQKYLIDGTIQGINHSGVFAMLPDSPVYHQRQELGIVLDEAQEMENPLRWINQNNPTLTVKERIMRDLTFRQRALELRYPVPYAERYLEYLKHLDKDFVPVSD